MGLQGASFWLLQWAGVASDRRNMWAEMGWGMRSAFILAFLLTLLFSGMIVRWVSNRGARK